MTEDENNFNTQTPTPSEPSQPVSASVNPAPQPPQSASRPVPPSGYAAAQTYNQPQAQSFVQSNAQPKGQGPVAPNGYAPYAEAQPHVTAPELQKKKSHTVVIVIVTIVVLILLAFSVVSCSNVVKSFTSSGSVTAASSANSVAVININSTIQYDGTANSPEGLKYLLDEAAADNNTIAVVLRVDSGGGTATAGEEMATYVREFRESTGKPVVVSSASLNASAAYMISSQANAIFVAKTTEIGAIGTALQNVDYSGLLEKLGISVDNITSSESKDSSYGTRALTDEERAYYQSMVDEINEVFIDIVAEGRNMSDAEVRKLATGMVFTGQTAIKNGLADKIGTLEDAEAYAAGLAGAHTYSTYNLDLSSSYDVSTLLQLLGESKSESDLAVLLKELSGYVVK